MKKCVIIPLASGYYNKAKSMSEEYGVDFDDRDLKPNQKIKDDKLQYSNIVGIGNMYTLNDKVISAEKLGEELQGMKKKRVVEKTKEKNVVDPDKKEKHIEDL